MKTRDQYYTRSFDPSLLFKIRYDDEGEPNIGGMSNANHIYEENTARIGGYLPLNYLDIDEIPSPIPIIQNIKLLVQDDQPTQHSFPSTIPLEKTYISNLRSAVNDVNSGLYEEPFQIKYTGKLHRKRKF
jgi:hypothetical protein